MIALVFAMVWTRRGQAVLLALLASFAVAAAVAAPAYLTAADRAVAAGLIATATTEERSFVAAAPSDGRDPTEVSFTDTGGAPIAVPGFVNVYASEFRVVGVGKDPKASPVRMVYRQDVCAHLRITAGRCVIAEGEIVLAEETATRARLTPGATVTLTYAALTGSGATQRYQADGEPKLLTVAGVYRVPEPQDPYWGVHAYFTGERPVFTTEATQAAMDHGDTAISIDGTAGPDALRVDNLDSVRAELEQLSLDALAFGRGVSVDSRVPQLLDRIAVGRAEARRIVPVIAVPLVLLACLTIWLASGYAAEGRRPEWAVVALRGSRGPTRWWLATGETVVAILAGSLAGCVAGQLLVAAVAAARLPGAGSTGGLSALRYAPLAAAAALLAALLAQRKQLFSPVAELLRRSSARGGAAREVAAEGVVVLLAAVAGAQLLLSGGELTGVGLFAPALILLAAALVAARLALPVVTRFAARALRRGRLETALAAFPVARRAGASRLFALLVAAVAVIGYATCAIDVAAVNRAEQATVGTGADRVLYLDSATRAELLGAVRAVDPEGAYAMAVVGLPREEGEKPGVAVDSTRLGRVANWPAGAPAAGDVARLLRPPTAEAVTLTGGTVTARVKAEGIPGNQRTWLAFGLAAGDGREEFTVEVGELRDGERTYSKPLPTCADGCRLKGIRLTTQGGLAGAAGSVTITQFGAGDPASAALRDPARWQSIDATAHTAGPDGLRVDLGDSAGAANGAWVQPADVPATLPIAVAGPAGEAAITGFDSRLTPVDRVARLPTVPQAGADAILVDLEYANRLATRTGKTPVPQVWLSADAPADARDRLAAQGLVILREVRADQVRAQLDRQGPALALGFYALAGVLAVVLAAGALMMVAAVDRGRRVSDLTALRVQGLRRRAVARATLWTYPVMIAAAVLAGLPIAALLWWLTGWALPLAGTQPITLTRPEWPRPVTVGPVVVVLFVTLCAAAVAAGRRIRKEVR